MEMILSLLIFVFVAAALLAGLFMAFVQPLWSIIDVATSEKHSSGIKAIVILLTLLLLGPIMTFFYACFGTYSRALRKCTITAAITLLVSIVSILGMAALQQEARENLTNIFGKDESKSGEPGVQQAASSGVPEMDEVAADALDLDPFKAVHYVPLNAHKGSASIADFTLSGPVEGSALPVKVSTYPLNQIAIDPHGPVLYGITTHKVGKIVPSTGHFVEMEIDPALPKMSWPAGIAFNPKNRKLLVASRTGVYSYDPATGEWLQPSGFDKLNFLSLSYDEKDQAYYGLVDQPGRKKIDRIVKLNETGAVLSSITLSHPLPAAGGPHSRIQLINVGKVLVILTGAQYLPGSNVFVESSTYIVNPDTGQIKRIADEA